LDSYGTIRNNPFSPIELPPASNRVFRSPFFSSRARPEIGHDYFEFPATFPFKDLFGKAGSAPQTPILVLQSHFFMLDCQETFAFTFPPVFFPASFLCPFPSVNPSGQALVFNDKLLHRHFSNFPSSFFTPICSGPKEFLLFSSLRFLQNHYFFTKPVFQDSHPPSFPSRATPFPSSRP